MIVDWYVLSLKPLVEHGDGEPRPSTFALVMSLLALDAFACQQSVVINRNLMAQRDQMRMWAFALCVDDPSLATAKSPN